MAEKTEIVDAIEALGVHCRPPLMEVEQRTSWMRDWISDLVQFPIEAITNGCRKWRHSGATKFPTAGQLLPLIRASMPAEKVEAVQQWRPLSDSEYEALSLSEKIRHHQILAHESSLKAGPMWRDGRPLHMDQMSPDYHEHMTRSRHHSAEVKRLREYMKRPQDAARALPNWRD